jgi:hypothetical protein
MIINVSYALEGLTEGRANLSWYLGFPKLCPNEATEDFSAFTGLMLNRSMEFTISNSSGATLSPLNSTTGAPSRSALSTLKAGFRLMGRFRRHRVQSLWTSHR